ncbi:hypothetical protein ACFXPA_03640 [Amycolatopsis sp. NPDC059090]|uniref:hypothetical protein n=1 Tax=unclassified Amycolatopsis TaxID=2618356 RepID=UPI00366D97ED
MLPFDQRQGLMELREACLMAWSDWPGRRWVRHCVTVFVKVSEKPTPRGRVADSTVRSWSLS